MQLVCLCVELAARHDLGDDFAFDRARPGLDHQQFGEPTPVVGADVGARHSASELRQTTGADRFERSESIRLAPEREQAERQIENDIAAILDRRAPPPRVEEAVALGREHAGGLGKISSGYFGRRMLESLARPRRNSLRASLRPVLASASATSDSISGASPGMSVAVRRPPRRKACQPATSRAECGWNNFPERLVGCPALGRARKVVDESARAVRGRGFAKPRHADEMRPAESRGRAPRLLVGRPPSRDGASARAVDVVPVLARLGVEERTIGAAPHQLVQTIREIELGVETIFGIARQSYRQERVDDSRLELAPADFELGEVAGEVRALLLGRRVAGRIDRAVKGERGGAVVR